MFAFQVRVKKCTLFKKAMGFFVSCLQMHKKQVGFVSSSPASGAPTRKYTAFNYFLIDIVTSNNTYVDMTEGKKGAT